MLTHCRILPARRWQEIKAYIEKRMAEEKEKKETRLNAKRRNA